MASRSWNKVELIGNLTRDPELRYTPSGSAVSTFTIATNRTYMSDGERKEEADFHRIVAWNKLAELCSQLLKKGNRVFVSGRLQNRSWEGQDGQSRQVTEIVIEDMILLTSKNGNSDSNEDFSERKTESQPKVDPSLAEKSEKEDLSKESEVSPAEDTSHEEKQADEKPVKEDPGDLEDLPF